MRVRESKQFGEGEGAPIIYSIRRDRLMMNPGLVSSGKAPVALWSSLMSITAGYRRGKRFLTPPTRPWVHVSLQVRHRGLAILIEPGLADDLS